MSRIDDATVRQPQRLQPIRALTRLGHLPVPQFLARYWQRRPLLIRQALPGFESPFEPDTLFELCARDEVESRLIERADRRWRLHHGPFGRRAIPPLKRPGWTLLLQGADHHLAAAADLLARFRFVPDARLDDLMVSYASDRGGVGPHVDSYDVFLLQAAGKRRWRIECKPDPTLVPDLPIRQLAHFRPQQEWLLEPGDLLYLPPGIAHDGVGVGACMTFSIGFRTPSWPDLAGIWAELQAERNPHRPASLRDAVSTAAAHPARLPTRMVEQAHRQLLNRKPRRHEVALALLRHLSEPKPRVSFEPPARPISRSAFADAIARRGLRVDPRTRMLYSNRTLAINGELESLQDSSHRAWMRSLADRRVMSAQHDVHSQCAVPGRTLIRLYEWYRAGWVHPHI